jgi:hypothetical protein
MSDEPLRFRATRREHSAVRTRDVKDWVRAATGAPDDATIVVTELSCSEPGCPPFEVVMAVLRPGELPLQKKLHKRLAELSRDEVVHLWETGEGDHQHETNETKE